MRKLGERRVRSKPVDKSPQRMMVGTRLSKEVKSKLDEAAARSGRSMAQEIELRLEQSFEGEALLGSALSHAFGKRLAGILLAVGAVMDQTGRSAAYWAMAKRKFTIPPLKDIDEWGDHGFAFEQAVQAAVAVLDWARPDERPERKALVASALGAEIASTLLREVESGVEPRPREGRRALRYTRHFKHDLSLLRLMLRPVLDRRSAKGGAAQS